MNHNSSDQPHADPPQSGRVVEVAGLLYGWLNLPPLRSRERLVALIFDCSDSVGSNPLSERHALPAALHQIVAHTADHTQVAAYFLSGRTPALVTTAEAIRRNAPGLLADLDRRAAERRAGSYGSFLSPTLDAISADVDVYVFSDGDLFDGLIETPTRPAWERRVIGIDIGDTWANSDSPGHPSLLIVVSLEAFASGMTTKLLPNCQMIVNLSLRWHGLILVAAALLTRADEPALVAGQEQECALSRTLGLPTTSQGCGWSLYFAAIPTADSWSCALNLLDQDTGFGQGYQFIAERDDLALATLVQAALAPNEEPQFGARIWLQQFDAEDVVTKLMARGADTQRITESLIRLLSIGTIEIAQPLFGLMGHPRWSGTSLAQDVRRAIEVRHLEVSWLKLTPTISGITFIHPTQPKRPVEYYFTVVAAGSEAISVQSTVPWLSIQQTESTPGQIELAIALDMSSPQPPGPYTGEVIVRQGEEQYHLAAILIIK